MNPIVSNDSKLQHKLHKIKGIRDGLMSTNRGKARINSKESVDMIIDLYKKMKSQRLIIGIGGCPGSGKTTITKDIVANLNKGLGAQLAAYLPMDGFHYANTVLELMGLKNVKGDITTYDVERYLSKLTEFKESTGATIVAPDYVRERHDVFENVIQIKSDVRILITEGIYIGYNEGRWEEVGKMVDILFYLDTSPEQCADRIAARNLQVGRSAEAIAAKLANDFWFMEKSLQGIVNSHYILASF